MHDRLKQCSIKVQKLMAREGGEDLVEYALVASLLSLAATALLGTLATSIDGAFDAIAATIKGG
jgi:pilus assembly protein Flp/PilA